MSPLTRNCFSTSPSRLQRRRSVAPHSGVINDPKGLTPWPLRSRLSATRCVDAGLRARDHSLGLVIEGGEDLVGVLYRVVENQAADREIDDFMTVPRSRPG